MSIVHVMLGSQTSQDKPWPFMIYPELSTLCSHSCKYQGWIYGHWSFPLQQKCLPWWGISVLLRHRQTLQQPMKVMRKPTMMSLQNQVLPKKHVPTRILLQARPWLLNLFILFLKLQVGKDQQIIPGRKEVQKGSANNTRKKRSTERISK